LAQAARNGFRTLLEQDDHRRRTFGPAGLLREEREESEAKQRPERANEAQHARVQFPTIGNAS
jgi:hypothetical protein